MASTYSQLKIELIGTGEQAGTWGATTNTNLGTAIEEAITGSVEVSFSDADITLTLTNTNASQAARNLRLRLTGTTTASRNLTVPDIEKFYIIANELANEIVVKNSTGTTYTVPAGTTGQVFSSGTGIKDAISFFSGEVLSSAAYILGGGIENTPIGAVVPSTIKSTDLTVNGNTTLGDASGDTINYKAAGWTFTNNPTVTGTWANLGSVTTVDINGGTIDGVTIGGSTPAAGTFTSLTDSALTSGRVTYATSGGQLTDSANLTFNGTTLTTTSLSDSGNLAFTGTGNRITGDFSNATIANRVAFQTSTTNASSVVGVLPNGSATGAAFQVYNNSTPTNASLLSAEASSTATTIASSIRGSGTYLPLAFNVNGSETLRLLTSGAISVGSSGTAYGTAGQVLTSQGNATPIWTSIISAYPSGTGIVTVSGGSSWGSTLTAPSGAIVGTSDTQTLTNKRINQRVSTLSAPTSLTPDVASYDMYNCYGLTGTLTIAAPTGTPVDGTRLTFRFLDNGVPRTLTWTSTWPVVIGVTLPTTTVANKVTYVGMVYSSTSSQWEVIAVTTQA